MYCRNMLVIALNFILKDRVKKPLFSVADAKSRFIYAHKNGTT